MQDFSLLSLNVFDLKNINVGCICEAAAFKKIMKELSINSIWQLFTHLYTCKSKCETKKIKISIFINEKQKVVTHQIRLAWCLMTAYWQ